MNPYLVLDVPPGADDASIRNAYLDAVKAAPPDRDPKRFQAVSGAYEKIKDEPSRHRFAMFDKSAPGESPLDTYVKWAQARRRIQPPTLESMKELLRACLKT